MSDPKRLRASSALLVLLACATFLSVGVFGVAEKNPAILIFFGLFGASAAIATRLWGSVENRVFVWVYCGAVLAALALFAIYTDRYGSPYYVGGSDDLAFEQSAAEIASSLGILDYSSIEGNIVRENYPAVGYIYLVSLLYRAAEPFGGFHTMLPRLLNCLVQGATAVLVYRLGKYYGLSDRSAIRAGLLVGFLPILVYNAVHTFRDAIVSFLIMWVVYIWTRSARDLHVSRRLFLWLQTFLVAGVVSQLRLAHAVAILVIAAMGDLLTSRRDNRLMSTENLYRAIVIVVLCLAVLVVFYDDATRFVERYLDAQTRYTEYRLDKSDGLSNYVFGASFPLTYLLRGVYGLVIPLPVLHPTLDRLWLSFGTIVWYFLLPYLILELVHSIRHRTNLQLVGAFVLLFGSMAMITFTARHISQHLPYGVLIAAIGFERYRRHRASISLATLWLGGILVIAYVVLKSG